MNAIVNSPYWQNFMGHSANWYKFTIIGFLIVNPILFLMLDFEIGGLSNEYIAGWVLVLEFIFCLAMALKCYPLLPGGLLAFQAIALGMTSTTTLEHEIVGNLEVILLLVFMVAGIYFMQKLILFLFTKMLVNIRNKVLLSFLFSFSAAFLSAFLDALTVTAVIISVAVGFYSIYHKVASGKHFTHSHDHKNDDSVEAFNREDLEQFRAFLRSLMMHAAVGTALGGVCTIVGEPQNIVIGNKANWTFVEFFLRMAPVTMPVLVAGLTTCVLLEVTGKFGYGGKIPPKVMDVIADYDKHEDEKRTVKEKASLVVQGIVGIWLIIALLFHFAPVGIIGLSIIVLGTVLTGITEEHQIGHAFEEALPFTALLVVFFAVVGVIADQKLFSPITDFVLSQQGSAQITLLYVANGLLSAISDNVFVATVYVNQMVDAANDGTISPQTFDLLSVAINTGTNIPSVATPNGQAAFLFLLTSAVAPLIRLSYMTMVKMALPYTIVMSIVGYVMVATVLTPATAYMEEHNIITKQEKTPAERKSASGDDGHGGHH